MIDFLKFFSKQTLSQSSLLAIESKIKKVQYETHHLLLEEGDISRKLYFVEKGTACAFSYGEEDKKMISWIVTEGDFVGSIDSFFGQTPSIESIEILEKATLWAIKYDDMCELQQNFVEIQALSLKLMEKYLLRFNSRLHLLLTKPAEKRIVKFWETQPNLKGRVPDNLIAAYLDMTPIYYSTAKREITLKEQHKK